MRSMPVQKVLGAPPFGPRDIPKRAIRTLKSATSEFLAFPSRVPKLSVYVGTANRPASPPTQAGPSSFRRTVLHSATIVPGRYGSIKLSRWLLSSLECQLS